MNYWKDVTGDELNNSGVIVAVPRSPRVGGYIVGEAYKLDGFWWWAQEGPSDSYACYIKPTHWMDLPEPPKP